jgi:hypothetical protein
MDTPRIGNGRTLASRKNLTNGRGLSILRVRDTAAEAGEALRTWLAGFADCVRRQAFDEGRAYFHPKAYCFGSFAKACEGLDSLVEQQWKNIWPNITGFEFDMEGLRYNVSPDGRVVCAMVLWASVGYDEHDQPYTRNGRVTVVLTRTAEHGALRALHTHYSLVPGTPQTSRRPTRRA